MGIQNIDAVNWGQPMGQALGQIVQGAHFLADPNFQFRRQLSQEMVTNPEIAQHLSDLEYQNPGSVTRNMRSMLTPSSAGMIAATPPSINARINRAIMNLPGAADKLSGLIKPEDLLQLIHQTVTGAHAPTPQEQELQRYLADPNVSDEDKQNARLGFASPAASRASAMRYSADSRENATIQAAMIRAQSAQTPEQRFELWRQRALFQNNLIAGREFDQMQARWGYDAQLHRPQYVNSINTAWTGIRQAQQQLRAASSDTERQGIMAGINEKISAVNFYRNQLGLPDVDMRMAPAPSTTLGVHVPGTSQVGTGQFVDSRGQPVNPTDTDVVPSFNAPSAAAPGGGPRNPRGPAPAATPSQFSPAQTQRITTAVSAARSVQDIMSASSLLGPEKAEAIRQWNAAHPASRGR